MFILVTDVLSCPRCGPEFGLILLSERAEARRVLEGVVACANCRERYHIRNGFADLRVEAPAEPLAGGRGAEESAQPYAADGESGVFRLLALLGISEGPALALLVGGAVTLASAMADRIEHLEVITADATSATEPERVGVTRVAIGRRLPFYNRSLRGVALCGAAALPLIEEAARVLAPLGRLVLEGADAGAADRVRRAGLRVLAEESRTLVAVRA
jgi:uncharacterized protein YbaR (Trm112 family)